MKLEERKLISIPRAIGPFMIFEGLFRKGSLSDYSGEPSALLTLAYISVYLLIGTGIFLCITRSLLFFYVTYITCLASLFGIVFEILPGIEVNLLWCIALGLAHLILLLIMIWTHIQIKKLMKETAQLN